MKRKLAGNGFRITTLALSLLSASVQSEEPVFLALNKVPEGFEALNRPQRSIMDVYYGNRYITSQLATYTPYKITLSNPASIVQLIGDISSPLAVEQVLTGNIDPNSADVCFSAERRSCGVLEPETAGVIFDESRFRVDVFINPDLLLTRAAAIQKYLPPAEKNLAWLNSFSGAYSGVGGGSNSEDDYTLNGISLLSYGENSLYSNWNYSKSQRGRVSDLYFQREFEGRAWRGGLLGTQGFGLSFSSDRTLYGVHFSSSDNTRLDTDFTGASPLDVFLPVRGRVEVRRDDRLLQSWLLEAGSQQLDTRSFPDGAYDIEIRVIDEQGMEVSRNTEFFTKQYSLPAEGEWRYFVESGKVLDRSGNDLLPENTSQWLTRAGVSRRLLSQLGGTVAVAANKDDALLEGGILIFGGDWELTPSVMLASDSSYGLNIGGHARLGTMSANLSYRYLWRDDNDIQSDQYNESGLLGDAFEQGSASVSLPVGDDSLSYRYSYRDRHDQQSTRTHSLDYRASLFDSLDYSLDGNTGISRSEDTTIIQASLTLRFKDGRWNYRAEPRADYIDDPDGSDHTERARISVSWEDGDLLAGELRTDFGAEMGDGDERFDGQLKYANSWGRSDLNINHLRGQQDSVTSYSASFSTSVLTNGDVVALGGEDRADSAVVVLVNGVSGDQFDVRVNGQRRGYAVAGRPSVISLSPYEQYRVTVSAPKSRLYDFDEQVNEVTLYPGNVSTLALDATPVQLIFGRLMKNGQPVTDARIEGGLMPGSTDDFGLYQLDTKADQNKVEVVLSDGSICQVAIPESAKKQDIVRMGTRELLPEMCSG